MNNINRVIYIFCFLFFILFSFSLIKTHESINFIFTTLFIIFNIILFYFFPAILSFLILKFIIYKNNFFSINSKREFLTMGEHENKQNISSMGGIAFIIVNLIYFIYFYFYNYENYISYKNIYLFILSTSILSGLVGLWDDLNKKYYKKGISVGTKFIIQGLCALIPSIYLYLSSENFYSNINFGFFNLNISFFYPLWAAFVIISTSHAVNLTDGIDGLAVSQSIMSLISFIIIIFCNLSNFNLFLNLICIIFLLTLIPYMYFNLNKAKVFMGDCGSLMIGSFLASIFLVKKMEILLIFSGIVFVIETLSVILQVGYYKIYKKRLFSFAPIHHALEKNGYSENKIVLLFFIISFFGQIIMLKISKIFYIK